MIEQLPAPGNAIIRVRVSDKLRHEDFTELFSLIDPAVTNHGKCRIVIELHDFHGWDLHGLWDDIQFHTTRGSGVERIAYVGDRAWEGVMINAARAFPGAMIRYFDASEGDAAEAWIEES